MSKCCPYCQGIDIVKNGKTPQGQQRFLCRESLCEGRTFIYDYAEPGQSRQVKEQIVDLPLNGSGIRDTAGVLHDSTSTVIKELKKKNICSNKSVWKQLNPEQVEVEIHLALVPKKLNEPESELEQMWSYVRKKENQRWLWDAIDHHSGDILAYVFVEHKDEVFWKLKALLEPFGITHFYTDGWGAYERHLESDKHVIGKQNTQQIENKHLHLRTRIKRLVRAFDLLF